MNAQKCENRIDEEYNKTIEAFNNMEIGSEEFNEYGLDFSLVEANTFNDQPEPYYRYQLSWGGPSEEFRIFEGGRAEYWFMDWFDGASRECTNEPIIKEIINFFEDVGLIDWAALIPERCENCGEIISPETGFYCDECRPYNVEITLNDLSRDEVIEALEGIIEAVKDESENLINVDDDDIYIEEAE